MGLEPLRRERERLPSLHVHAPRKGHVSTQGQVVVYVPGRGLSPRNESARSLSFDFPVSWIVRDKGLLFKPPSLSYVVIAAQAILRQEVDVLKNGSRGNYEL